MTIAMQFINLFWSPKRNLDGAMLLTPIQEAMLYDKRKFMPFKGNIRKEDLVTQGTQGYDELRREKDSLGEFAVGNGPHGMSIGESPVVPVAAAIAI